MKKIDIVKAQVTILLEIDGEMHLVAMDKSEYKLVSDLIKKVTKAVVPIGVSQSELLDFVDKKEGNVLA